MMTNSMSNIKHIVYLMLENRSLDNVLGWLYWGRRNHPLRNIPAQSPPTYEGLIPNKFFNLDKDGNKFYATMGTGGYMNVPSFDPFEEYEHVNNQLFLQMETPVSPTPPSMGGFYQDYYTIYDSAYQIMQSYTPDELPVLNGLASRFAVSDMYFSSVPTQTNCNRAFAATGNSLGMNKQTGQLEGWVNNHFGPFWDPKEIEVTFNQRTMWNVLSDHGRDSTDDWMVYYSEIWKDYCFTRDMLDQIQPAAFDPHFQDIKTFYSQAKSGTLPAFSFLEPEWGLKKWHFGVNGNDYHPPCNLLPGEQFVLTVYNALRSNPDAWAQTLLIINFDEHGGTYDHYPPPWGAAPPWGHGTPEPDTTEQGFLFDRYGVRVPLILVSPFIESGTVFRAEGDIPYDHTSVIATVLNHMGVPREDWQLGSRTFNAPSFENVLTLSTPDLRDDKEALVLSEPKDDQSIDYPYNDLQFGIAKRALAHGARGKLSDDEIRAIFKAHFAPTETISELSAALANAQVIVG